MALKSAKCDEVGVKITSFDRQNRKNRPAAGGPAPRPSSIVTKDSVTVPVGDTLELHQFVQYGAKSGSFCKKKTTTNVWFTPLSNSLLQIDFSSDYGPKAKRVRNTAGLVLKLRIVVAVKNLKISFNKQILMSPHF